jgi:transcriptional regulator with XRE-family HTH domain
MATRPRELPSAPPNFWERTDVAEALADRDIGAVLRSFRVATGASQMDVSALVGIPQPHVSELERGGRRVTSLALFERFADGLGIPRQALGLAELEHRADDDDQGAVAVSQREWLRTRRLLNEHRGELTQLAGRLYPEPVRLGDTGVLMPAVWRPAEPVDLADIRLTLETAGCEVNGAGQETRQLRPLAAEGRRFDRYHRAMRDLAKPRLFENRVAYRMLGLDWGSAGGELRVGEMRYFDMIDVGEAAAHELALVAVDRRGNVSDRRATWDHLPFRRMIRDPFDTRAYPLLLSISTLTIRKSRAGATFLLLRRDDKKVAIAGGMLSVIPTGVFQPASIIPAPDSPDFDLWRNVMREYSEEFLGCPEHDGNGDPIDYANTEPFRTLDAARAAGGIRVQCLGAGVDALNLVSDLFTVAVFEAEVFDHVFDGLVEANDEGDVTHGQGEEEFSFDERTVQRLLTSGQLAPSGAACLALAWEHRAAVLG